MHELSIAMNILDIIREEMKKNNAGKLVAVELEIGALSGVVKDALEFAFEEALKQGNFQDARIIYHEQPGMARCSSCGAEFVTEDYITPCPECFHPYTDIIRGRELKIRSIVIE